TATRRRRSSRPSCSRRVRTFSAASSVRLTPCVAISVVSLISSPRCRGHWCPGGGRLLGPLERDLVRSSTPHVPVVFPSLRPPGGVRSNGPPHGGRDRGRPEAPRSE